MSSVRVIANSMFLTTRHIKASCAICTCIDFCSIYIPLADYVEWTLALTAKVFNISYEANSNKIALALATLEHKGPSVSHTTMYWSAFSSTLTDQPITALVLDSWPVEIAWYVVVFVVRTFGTRTGRSSLSTATSNKFVIL